MNRKNRYWLIILILLYGSILYSCQNNEVIIENDDAEKANPEIFNLEVYAAVLNNEIMFFSTLDKGNIYWNQYVEKYYPDCSSENTHFTVMDLDKDGRQEVIIEFSCFGDKEVLRYNDGIVYGHNFVLRSMSQLKNDGTSGWSNSAFEGGYGTYKFNGEKYEFIELAHFQLKRSDADEDKFLINNIPATEEEMETYIKIQEEKEDASWHQITKVNIKTYLLENN